MDLFTPVVPVERQHENFRRVLVPGRVSERAVVSGWAEGFPDRDNKFLHEFQTTFNSSFWEVYLYGLFKSYSFSLNWSQASPDFWLTTAYGEIIVEAVTANAAEGKEPEWDKKSLMSDAVRKKDFWPLNREAIIRLSNALSAKVRKYEKSYKKLSHVPGKPFVIAVAPFEQPDFQHQYDRAMRALLYNDYVDEKAYFEDPARFPDGPPSVRLDEITKDNGSTFELGIFENDDWAEVSAVIFSCVATWGKAVAMSNDRRDGFIMANWGTDESGKSESRESRVGIPSEEIHDGLQIFHNPYASNPVDLRVFRRKGVVQHYLSQGVWIREGYDDCLQFRFTYASGAPFRDSPHR
ncbi:hypothetical protein GE543_14450 [Pseudomonas sp. SZ57]|uniref:hypothetical protein n=1 Tax=Pseudomonas sp. SZ57 TaxID=2662259 RepID=UPI001291617B|nr:hypothetical protein [Pseudomonas sp. SZ57]MQQ35497.1 hypothetical protein [Pseudomonas sp. SZ57]